MVDRVGQQLGNYVLVRLLGHGGFAEVYLGEHLHLGSQAAVKVLRTSLEDNDVERFLREAQTVARLKHPHIVRIFDFDVVNDTPFLVMSYAAGGTLRHRHPKGTMLPLTTIITYVKQITDALQYAHDQHLIHRDVKQENMLVGRRDEVLLSDFGIAIVAQSSRYQSTQEMVGTMAYMAPEQIQGKPQSASDQYALGIVVYEWLSGDRPFHGSLMEIVTQHLAVLPPPLREKVPTVSADVEKVVLKALEKDPRQRYSSVQEFAQALAAAAEQPGPVRSTIIPTIRATPQRIAPLVHQKTKEQWLDEGDAHHNDGRYKEAIVAYDRAIQLDPNDANVYYNRGNAYSNLKQFQQAIADYDRAIALNPNDADIYYNRGNAYSDLKQYQQAIADYDRAIRLDPNHTNVYYNRGVAYFGLKKYHQAIADYDRAIQLDPNDAPTYFNRGEAYSDLEEYQQAIADYTRTIALDPTYALAYCGRGFAYFGVKHYRRAIQDYDHALQLDPNITWVNVAREEAYKMLKRQQ